VCQVLGKRFVVLEMAAARRQSFKADGSQHICRGGEDENFFPQLKSDHE